MSFKLKQRGKFTPFAIMMGAVVLLGLMTGGFFLFGGAALLQTGETGFTETEYDYIYVHIDVEGNTLALELDEEEELADVTVTPYVVITTDMTEEEIADIIYSDFTAGTAYTSVDSGDKLDLVGYDDDDEDAITVFLIEHADCWDYWLTEYIPGQINEVVLINASADANLQNFAQDGSSSTIANTTVDDWTFMIFAETTDTDFVQGYPGLSYDFENDCWNRTGVQVLLNTTAKGSYVTVETPGWTKEISGNYIYFWQNEPLLYGSPLSVNIKFAASTNNVEFNVTSAAVVWGSLEGDVTAI